MQVRTDLAVEARESVGEGAGDIHGVSVTEETIPETEIHITKVIIDSKNGAKAIGKPMGIYITLDVPNMMEPDEEYHSEISHEIARHLREMLQEMEKEKSILVVGLGNRDVTADALAARSTKRLNRTIQITNTGIHPGSEVGNYRNALTEESLGIPVIAIGIPTVVDAGTIVNDVLEKSKGNTIDPVIMSELNNFYVTGKDIDETIKRLSFTVSEALNEAFEI